MEKVDRMPNHRKKWNPPPLVRIFGPVVPKPILESSRIRQIFRIAGYLGSDLDLDLLVGKWEKFRDELNQIGHEHITVIHFVDFLWQTCQRWFVERVIQTLKEQNMY